MGWKYVDDPIDRLHRVGRVQRGKDQMAGFRGLDGGGHRVQIAHFPHDDDVRVLAQGCPETRSETVDIHADFPLADQAFLFLIQIFWLIWQTMTDAWLLFGLVWLI